MKSPLQLNKSTNNKMLYHGEHEFKVSYSRYGAFTAESKQHQSLVQPYALGLHNLLSEEMDAKSTKQINGELYLYGVKEGWGR